MTVDPSYTVTIPAAIVIPDETQTVEATVSAADVVIDPGNQLKVTIGETFSVIKQDQDLNTLDTLDFTVKIGDTVISTGGTVLEVPAGTATGSATLAFTVTGSPKYAGDYTGTVTFTISVVTSGT